jgi:sulfatase modifying factor 1
VGGSVKRWFAAVAASIVVLGTSLLAGSCANPMNWELQMMGLLDMVKVQGGTMMLGDVEGYGMEIDETPTHYVTLSTFYISRFEVSQQLFDEIMGYNPSYFTQAWGFTDDLLRPVETVSWHDALLFCNALSQYVGLQPCYDVDDVNHEVTWYTNANGYRLPTEAEWEYAARGGINSNHTMFSGGNLSDLNYIAWYDNAPPIYVTYSIGSLGSNELGLYDMTGNVWEWCWDAYDNTYYSTNTIWVDPRGPFGTIAYTGGSYNYIRRGGSIFNLPDYIRNAYRGLDLDTTALEGIGLRVVRNK